MDWPKVLGIVTGVLIAVIALWVVQIWIFPEYTPSIQDRCFHAMQQGQELLISECSTFNCTSWKVQEIRCVT